jgi:serine/threonine protein kinase
LQLESFERVRVLGVGGSGIVYELLHKSNGQRFAMKEIEIKNVRMKEMAISEAEMLKDIMENISHPNILPVEKVRTCPFPQPITSQSSTVIIRILIAYYSCI